MPAAHFEPIGNEGHGIVRVDHRDDWQFGEPYAAAFFVENRYDRWRELFKKKPRQTAYAKALAAQGVNKSHLTAVQRCLRDAGFRSFAWDRRTQDGQPKRDIAMVL